MIRNNGGNSIIVPTTHSHSWEGIIIVIASRKYDGFVQVGYSTTLREFKRAAILS